jgi:hypothetical protein
MSWGRIVRIALLLYLVADYSDPSLPGVFSLHADSLFLDGALEARAQPSKARFESPAPPPLMDPPREAAPSDPPSRLARSSGRPPVPCARTRIVAAACLDARSEDH